MIYRKKSTADADKKCDIFISYRRDGGDMTAMHFYQSLKARGYNVFFDLEVLRTGRFNEALLQYIERCEDFVLILSPHALDRCNDSEDWVRREIAQALKLKKNIVPVMMKGFTFPPDLPEDISDIRFQNGLSSSSEYFEESLNRLCERYLHSKPTGVARKTSNRFMVPILAAIAVLAVGFGMFMALNRPAPEIIEVVQVTETPAEAPADGDGSAAETVDASATEAAEIPDDNAADTSVPEPEESPSPEPKPLLVRDTDFPVLMTQPISIDDTEDIQPDSLNDSPVLGHPTLCRRDIGSVLFLPSLEGAPEDAWDVSADRSGDVLAWVSPTEETALYDLTIAGNGGVKLMDSEDDLYLFTGWNNVKRIDFNGCVDCSSLMDFTGMFQGCYALEVIDFNGVCTDHAINMQRMFGDCRALKALDLSGFSTARAEYMDMMFDGCEKLETLDVSMFSTDRIEYFTGMFRNCMSLKLLDLSNMNTSLAKNFSDMFNGCQSLDILDISSFDTGRAVDMSRMFKNCQELDLLDVSGFDTSRVQNMSEMFAGCYSLRELDVSRFNTERVENMAGMFLLCLDVSRLDVKGFNTARVTDMNNMFNKCFKLDGLDLSGWDTANVYSMKGMFKNCSALYRLDLNSFDTSKVKNMTSMFEDCSVLVEALTTNWDVSSVECMDHIFSNCSLLEDIGRTPDSLLHGTAEGAFEDCYRLEGQDSYIPREDVAGLEEVDEEI